MTTKTRIALFSLLAIIASQAYLTWHYYPLKYGLSAGDSICNISSTFSCDATSASSYAAFLGVPISIWGSATALIALMAFLLWQLRWTDQPERVGRLYFWLSAFMAAAAIVMATISSTVLGKFCLFCIIIYVFSFLNFFMAIKTQDDPPTQQLGEDVKWLLGDGKAYIALFVAVPALAWLGHKSMLNQYGAEQLEQAVATIVEDWKAAPEKSFSAPPLLTMGAAAAQAKVTLKEFADFRCGHCRRAAPSLKAFLMANPGVRLEFFSFPLDGSCNPEVPHANGISCRLAFAVYCAEKSQKGWFMHDKIFGEQDAINQLGSVAEIDNVLSSIAEKTGLVWNDFKTCLDAPETKDAVAQQSKQGKAVGIQGTPTIFANQKLLSYGHMLPVLEKVLDSVR